MKQNVNLVKKSGKSLFLIIILILIIFVAMSSYTIIPGGYQGIIFSKISGIKDVTLSEGFHFKTPIVDEVVKIEVRTKKIEQNTISTSLDQQIVETTYALTYRVNKEQAGILYREVGLDFENRIIVPALQGSIKTVMAQYAASDLIRKRDEVAIKIKEIIAEKLKESYLTVVGFELTDIDFSEKYDLAIEAKVQAEQEALKAKNELERIKIEAEQKIIQAEASKQQTILEAEAQAQAIELRAQADAKAIEILQEQLDNSPDYLEFKKIEKWDGVLPSTYAGTEDVFMTIGK